ncbi:ARM repeat-containing protein [Lepidopterella palustris CBS 459.81]|uniref:ARM repeat-containing protein n=1 Tax=Lepidopterella palustris CBS 459.81 TaxID=1314670 RepID=A0A8E2JHC5_9PEZI|nr:ARM repeat-containing protein [Lepidopterella palustris CBS 459.81]
MATRSRRSAATEVVEEEEEQDGTSKLSFNETLTGRPGKPIPVGELLRRLQALSQELRGMDQEEANRDSLLPVAKELAQHNLLQHKDAGVRAWTACCVVDMFRLCAPDAPYTASQLKDVFTLFIAKIFPALADPSNPYNGQHIYTLKSLAEVKSIVLLSDLPGSNSLILHLFTHCFDILSGPSKADSGEELSKNVEHHMTALLALLVDESEALPQEVVDVILAQFLRADPRAMVVGTSKSKKNAVDDRQSTLLLKEAPPAYNMAKNICNSSPDKMARLIGQYFSAVIMDASAAAISSVPVPKHRSRKRASSEMDDPGDDAPRGPTEEDMDEARKAHRLLRELWRCSPGVLQDIIPHLQEELGAENVELRLLATETFGDMISGIGAAGPPPPQVLNPVAYPSQSLVASDSVQVYNFLTTPTSPHSFPSRYAQAYQAFLLRKQDKSPIIRAAWASAVGRILMTSAGGVGLDPEEEQKLLRYLSESLVDGDERVRLAAVKIIEQFAFADVIQKLGSMGSISEPRTVLFNLADRAKDKKHSVRTEAMKLLAKIWGVAAGAIAEGNERTATLLGPIPSKILETCYINDIEINALVDHVMFESLLPLGYPPIKAKPSQNGGSQVVKDSQKNGESTTGYTEAEIDKIRTERQLVLIKDLEERAKKVYFARQGNQVAGAKYMEAFLKKCEDYNGGVVEKDEKEIKQQLGGLIAYYAKVLPDSSRVTEDLWKFAKAHDRRSYQLIRFCMAPDSDYRKVFKSIKELTKRVEDAHSSSTLLETLKTLVYRVSILTYNRSHVPAIIEFSRTDEKGLGAAAHEVLKEISTKHPDVFKAHVQELCKALESEAPSATKPNGTGSVDDLKACASFARKFPKDLPKDRKFVQSMIRFALYGTPPTAAKYAVTIIMSSADKKEMHAKDILRKCTEGFEYGSENYLTKLAALSQLVLLGPRDVLDDSSFDAVVDIAINQVLLKARANVTPGEPDWMETPDDDVVAKTWALKILINRLRSHPKDSSVNLIEDATPVYKLLNTLVAKHGELVKAGGSPAGQKTRLRLLAAQLLLKLSCTRRLDAMLTPSAFNALATVAQDPCTPLRVGFVTKLMKYLGQNRLPPRFYSILFLLAFEPNSNLKDSVVTWIKSQRSRFASRKETTLETVFTRVISLLAHHPDFDPDPENLKDFVQYILFYLKCVATPENLSLIYHAAQRVKGIADGISNTTAADENLYILSDLAQAVIRQWEEVNGWSMQAWPGKLKLPAGIFKVLESHERAQEIADKAWIDEDVIEGLGLEGVVRGALRTKKRKSGVEGAGDARARKKAKMPAPPREKKSAPKPVRTPKKKSRKDDDSDVEGGAAPSSEARRRSGRKAAAKSYAEQSDDEDDEEMETWQAAAKEKEEEETEESEAESEKQDSGHANEDIEMTEAGAEAESEVEPEDEPEPEPVVKPARTRGSKKMNGTAPAAETKKKAPPAAVNGKGRAKAKANGKAASTPPKTNGRPTRSNKAKPVIEVASDEEDLSDVPESDDE